MTRLADLLARDRPALGTWNQIPAPEVIDLIGWSGFDFAVIDCEHGAFGLREAEAQARACDAVGLAPVVRAPSADPAWIGRALDAGIGHVLVPDVSDPGALAACVAATRFSPRGTRGACPCVRSGRHEVRDWPAYAREQEAGTGILGLLESVEGLDALDALLEVDGTAGWMLGPFDLAVSMGHEGDWRHPSVSAALEDAAARIVARGAPLAVPIFAEDRAECAALARRWAERGARMILVGTDKLILGAGLRGGAGLLG